MHARYLLGRVHHLAEERPEAAAQYKAVLDEFDARKKAAEKQVQDAALDAEHKAALNALLHGPTPEYVSRSRYYIAVLQYEDGRFGEAGDALTKIIQAEGNSPLAAEAKLRLGYCNLQLKKFGDAAAALDPLKDDRQFGDRALWWLARAKIGAVNQSNSQEYVQAANGAVELLRKAADRAKENTADPQAKSRRDDILMDLADTQQLGHQYKEAAATYQQVISDDPKSDRGTSNACNDG